MTSVKGKINWRASDLNRVHKWCEENVGLHGQGWHGSYERDSYIPVFNFERESDAIMFALRWS